MKVYAVDLFCGAGGMSCGLNQAGIEVLLGVDFEKACKFAYEHNNNHPFLCKDVMALDEQDFEPILKADGYKLLVGCPPCQLFSSIAKHKRRSFDYKSDVRYNLISSLSRAARIIKPDIIAMENVPGLINESSFIEFVQEIIDLGYWIDYAIVNAADYGVPQARKRLIFLASKHFPIAIVKGSAKHVTVMEAIGHLRPINCGEQDIADIYHISKWQSELTLERIKYAQIGVRCRDWKNKDLIPKRFKSSLRLGFNPYQRINPNRPSVSITSACANTASGGPAHYSQDRSLSLREAALLQSFPPQYQFCPSKNVKIGTTAKMIGNAVPPKLAKAIGAMIRDHF